jgi:DNA repair protein RecO (recombination protein O)
VPTVSDHAVCVRRLDWSETSQIVVLMCLEHGKVSATAKGAKRQTPSTLAKFSGGVDLLAVAGVVMILKPGQDMANLIEWDLTEPNFHLRQDLEAHRLSMYAADLVHHLIQDHDPHPNSYFALVEFLAALVEQADRAIALLRFQWALIRDLGFRPILDRDAQTGEDLSQSETYAFSATAGGVVADVGGVDRWRVRAETVHLLREIDAGEATDASGETTERANRLLCVYLRSILDRQLPTMQFILGQSND